MKKNIIIILVLVVAIVVILFIVKSNNKDQGAAVITSKSLVSDYKIISNTSKAPVTAIYDVARFSQAKAILSQLSKATSLLSKVSDYPKMVISGGTNPLFSQELDCTTTNNSTGEQTSDSGVWNGANQPVGSGFSIDMGGSTMVCTFGSIL